MRPEPLLRRFKTGVTRTFHSLPALTALLGLLWLCGCQHSTSAADPYGDYRLVSVNGKPVPCTVEHDGRSIAIQSGTFTICTNGTCRSQILFSTGPGREASREVKATYTLQGSELNMLWEGAGQTRGRVRGDTFTMNNEGMELAYRR